MFALMLYITGPLAKTNVEILIALLSRENGKENGVCWFYFVIDVSLATMIIDLTRLQTIISW